MNPRTLNGFPPELAQALDAGLLAFRPDGAPDFGGLETDVRLAEHLRSLSRVYGASLHDLRTPLHTIVLYLELLRQRGGEGPEPDREIRHTRYLDVIGSEVQRLERMLDTIVGQVRMSGDSVEAFDLRGSLEDLHAFLEPYWRRLRVQARLSVPDEPVVVRVSREAVKHALLGIALNATDPLSPGGDLSLAVAAGRRAVVSVVGRPASAPPEPPEISLLARPQAPESLDRSFQVAGRIIERQNGSVRRRSDAAQGTTVEIELPLATERD